MFRGFRAFLLRGNVVDLAVAVVIGSAFTAVVTAFSTAFITPLIAAVFGGGHGFGGLTFTFNGVQFPLYIFINALFAFVITAAIVFYPVVTPINALLQRSRKQAKPENPPAQKCPQCPTEGPIAAQ